LGTWGSRLRPNVPNNSTPHTAPRAKKKERRKVKKMTKEMTMTKTKTKAKTLRSDLGYTEADLAELKNVVCNGDQAADLPPFPRPADYADRRAIYQFLQAHGKYAPLFAWCRSKEITQGFSGMRTSELYADDPAAKVRHWQLANTQEQLYNAILANEAFATKGTPAALRLANAEKAEFYKLLESLSTDVKAGEWGAVPPSEIVQVMPILKPMMGKKLEDKK